MNEYDQRQYRLMLDAIENIELNTKSLDRVIFTLEALLAVLTDPEVTWVESFRTELGDLEQVYTHNLQEGNKALDAQGRVWSITALENLRALILGKLEQEYSSKDEK